MFLIRKLHKWFGLILGLQFLLWAVSGALMALLDHHTVKGRHAVVDPAPLAAPAQPLPLAAVSQALGLPVYKLELKPLLDRYVFEAATSEGVKLLDAVTGAPVAVDAAFAQAVAVSRFSGQAPVEAVTYVDTSTHETRDMVLPVWRVAFADPNNHALLVSAKTGEILGAKNDTWRLWDIAWMLHIMDYKERQSFNHPLIITLSVASVWIALSGIILLFRSFRRSDFAWVIDPIQALAARRRRPSRPGEPASQSASQVASQSAAKRRPQAASKDAR